MINIIRYAMCVTAERLTIASITYSRINNYLYIFLVNRI